MSLLGCHTCDLDYCANCEPVTLEMLMEQLTTLETLTEQLKPTKLEMPTEQLTSDSRQSAGAIYQLILIEAVQG